MTPLTHAQREAMYTEYLRVEGYRPDQDADGYIIFSRAGRTYYVFVGDDAEYFCVMAGWPLGKGKERVRARKAALVANDSTKVARMYLTEDKVFASVGLYCTPPEAFKPVFNRVMRALEYAIDVYRKTMDESE